MSNEASPKQPNAGESQRARDLIGDDGVDSLIAEFGTPEPGTPKYAETRGRFAAEDDLDARATAPDTEVPERVIDLRDGSDPKSEAGLEDNDPVTDAIIAASNGDRSKLEALGKEDRDVADAMLVASADTGNRPADMVADLQNPFDNGQLPDINPEQRQDPAA